jgi:hypothetical protein
VRADEITGKTVLVGLTYLTADGRVRDTEQLHGIVVSADEERGIEIRQPSGEIFLLPPAFDSFEPAEPGEYALRSSGEVISDPDLLCSWTITAPATRPSTIVGWVDHYLEGFDLYEAFASRLEDLLTTLFRDRGLDFEWMITFSISGDKLRRDLLAAWRNHEPVDDPFESSLRVIGLTIGLESPKGLQELEELLETEFVVDRTRSTTLAELGGRAGRLGDAADGGTISYELPTYLIELDARRADLPEWSPYAGLKLRIDPTTHLHDAWRNTLDELPFRSTSSYPPELGDSLVRLASSVEAADTELGLFGDSVESLLDEHRESIAAGELDLPLNGITLLAYIHVSELVQSVVELAAEVGFRHDPDDWPGWIDIEDGTLWLLRRDGVETLAELDAFLGNALPRTRETLERFLELAADAGFTPWAMRDDLIEWLWLVFQRADAETVAFMYYRDEIERAVNTLIGNPVAASDGGP